MNKEKVSFFSKLFYSIAKFDQYPRMIKEGVGKAFLYLFLFSLIFGTISGVIVGYQTNQGLQAFVGEIEQGLPDFTLTNGELHVEGEMPIVLEEDDTLMIIDTTGLTSPSILDDYPTGLLVFKDSVIYKKSVFETRQYRFSDFGDVTLTKADILTYLPLLKWIGVIFGIFVFLFFYIAKIINAFILTILSFILSAIQKAKISFAQMYSMSIYALTLPILIDVLLKLFNLNLRWYLYYGIAFVFMWMAIRAMNRITTNPVEVLPEESELND